MKLGQVHLDTWHYSAVADDWRECFVFWLLALLKPATYRLGEISGRTCVFWKT